MQLDKVIKGRYSCKKFKSEKPNWRDIIECIDVARFSPMAGNIFTPRFILVDDKEKIKNLAEASQQDFISKVDYVIVICSECSLTKNAYEDRAERYCRQQAGAAIQTILLKIQDKGLSACWVGHFVDIQISEILKIPENFLIEAMIPVGFEYSQSKRREKKSIDGVLYFNEFGNIKMKNPKRLYV